MIRGEARRLALGAFVLLVLGAFVAARLQVTTDITYFLPRGQDDADMELVQQLLASELSRAMVLLVDAPDAQAAPTVSRAFEAALHAQPGVADELAFVEGGPPAGLEEALWELYRPRTACFLATDPAAATARLADAGLRDAVERLKRRLALPISSLLTRVAPEDPLLVLPDLFERVAGARDDGLSVADGRFVTADGRGAVLFLATRATPFDSTVQRRFLDGVQAAFERVDADFGGGLGLARSGANRFSVQAEDSMRADINRVSTLSLVGIGLLFLVLFRSLRLVLVTLPVVGAGFLAGTAACLVLFGSVHGLTLAFGSALIGVSVDYSVHFYCHQLLAPHPGGPRSTLAAIWPGLLLGAATTVIGFMPLIVSSFPGLRELAVFGSFGLAAALAATHVFLPGLLPASPRPTRACSALAAGLERVVAALDRRRGFVGLFMAGVVALGAVGLPRVRWNDGIADLGRLDPELLAEDAAIRERVMRYEQGRFVVAVGADEEQALAANDRVAQALEQARDAGEIAGYRSVAALLPSADRQRAVAAALHADPTLWPRLEAQLRAAGFVPEAFAPFRDALAAAPPEPLVWDDLLASPLAPLIRPFRVELAGGGRGVLSFVSGLQNASALGQRLAEVPGARLIDIQAVLTHKYATYRARMTSTLLLGLLAVVGLVWLRHRAVRPMLAACVPSLLSVVGTVALLALCGVELNLLSLVSLLMIVSMGIDYGIFLTEAGEGRGAVDAAQVSVFVAGWTTVLGFGLLALSSQPALFAIGLTTGVGMTLCLLFAMTLVVFFREPPR